MSKAAKYVFVSAGLIVLGALIADHGGHPALATALVLIGIGGVAAGPVLSDF